MPPPRYAGRGKDTGPQYVRGIEEWNGDPPGDEMWVEYSMHKEDMWVSRVPVPIRYKVEKDVNDNFENMIAGGVVTDWNIYSPKFAPAEVVNHGDGKCLRLRDRSPYDYAKAVRVFPETGEKVTIAFEVLAAQNNSGQIEIEVLDSRGRRPVRLVLNSSGKAVAQNGSSGVEVGSYQADAWYKIKILIDVTGQKYDLNFNGVGALKGASFAESATSVERLEFRTGAYRLRDTVPRILGNDMSDPDKQVPEAAFDIDNVSARKCDADLNSDGVVNFLDYSTIVKDENL
jgi:hypothetical protein